MVQANVTVHFEAETPDAVQEAISGWTLHDGCNVYVNVSQPLPPMESNEDGSVSEVPPPETAA